MSKKVKIGKLWIGEGERIALQSMSTYKISDLKNSISQTVALKNAGCNIMRFSVLDDEDAKSFIKIKEEVDIPLVADVHFDYRLAIKSIEGGADKIRINPGNVGGEDKIKLIADALKERNIPIRVGSNTGSIEKEFLDKYGKNEISLGESALKKVLALEKYGVENIVISVKASSVPLMIKAYEYVAKRTNYPLHLGVTEAGTEYNGIIKNAIGIGSLLSKGIGDTLRVSLSADPIKEIEAGKAILRSLELIDEGAEVIACPTCGRCAWDCMGFAQEVEEYLKGVKKKIRVAVMGCVVNGPGEAKDADVGIAGGKGEFLIFSKGEILEKANKENYREKFFREVDKCIR